MVRPILTSFNQIAELTIQKYERYLPTAFDESLTLVEKMNVIIEYLNKIGKLSNDVVALWNSVMEWLMNEGLQESVDDKLDRMVEDGTLASLINEVLFDQLNKKIDQIGVYVDHFGAVGDGISDDCQAIQDAIDFVYEQGGGVVHLGSNVYGIGTTPVRLRLNVSLKGVGSRGCKLKKLPGSTGNIIEFYQENNTFTFNTSYAGFTIEGTGAPKSLTPNLNFDPTNNGFLINAYWGLDGCRFEDILITDCGNYGLKIQPSALNPESEKMVMQQSQFDNVTVQRSVRGVHISGFVGNIQWNSCTFDFITNEAFYSALGPTGHGPQDNVFTNCAFQFSSKGFYAEGNFINYMFQGGCHFEQNDLYDAHFNVNAMCGYIGFDGVFFANTPIHLYFEKMGGMCSIDNVTYKSKDTTDTTLRYIKVGQISGLIHLGYAQAKIRVPVTQYEDPYLRLRGYKNTNANIFSVDHLQVQGITSGVTRARNLSRRETIQSSQVDKTTYEVVFDRPEDNDFYQVLLQPEWTVGDYWPINKTVNGFTFKCTTPPDGSYAFNWMILR